MISLFLDSAMRDLAVGIAKDGKIIYSACFPCWQRQSEMMIPELEKALNASELSLLDVDEVIVGKGPGSYTGVRIAMTIGKVICTAEPRIKIKLVSSLLIQGLKGEKFISVMNARSARSYIMAYDGEKNILEDTIFTNQQTLDYIAAHPDFRVVGDVSYLGLENREFSLVEGMNSFGNDLVPEEDVLSVKPVYLKD